MKSIILFPFIVFLTATCFAQNEILKDSLSASFAYNQSVILDAEKLLAQLDKLDAASSTFIKLIGYTDSTGTLNKNRILAADRIRSVETLLKSSALKQVSVETVNANETSGFRITPDELNRRVDILFFGKNDPPKPEPALSFELNKPVNLNINFVGGQAVFLKNSYPNLEKLKTLMLEDTTLLVKLHGHVCCADDMPLSVKRAQAVMQYLIHSAIDEKRISAQGFSNSMPLAPDNSEVNMSGNRRVEAIFYRRE